MITPQEPMMRIDYHTDNGHGWLFVSNQLLAELKLSQESFSPYSYHDKDGVYAEEDCDSQIVIKAIQEHGKRLIFRELHQSGSHWIRDLKRCGV